MSARRPRSVDSSMRRTNSSDSIGGRNSRNSRPSSSSRHGSGKATLTPDKPVLGLFGGSDALRRVMRQLTRDSMADKNLAETVGEEEDLFDEEFDSDEDISDKNVEKEADTTSSEDDGHRHLHNGRYLSCKRYPWICLKSNCQHKKDFSGDYTAVLNKNAKVSQNKTDTPQETG